MNAYLARDRVGSLHLSTATPPPEAVRAIPVKKFLPNVDDEFELRDEFRYEIGVMLNLFDFLVKEGCLPNHKRWKESMSLSEIVHLFCRHILIFLPVQLDVD